MQKSTAQELELHSASEEDPDPNTDSDDEIGIEDGQHDSYDEEDQPFVSKTLSEFTQRSVAPVAQSDKLQDLQQSTLVQDDSMTGERKLKALDGMGYLCLKRI